MSCYGPESFEDHEMAQLINEVFIPIKVDREERPDIDCTYLAACQIITNSGGWPLTVLLTPDLKPFFAGTYYPKESISGSVGLKELILNVQGLWKNQEDELLKSADEITAALKRWASTTSGELIPESVLERAFNILSNNFDEYGGFGHGQKFPSANHLLFLLHHWNRTGDENALSMVEKTLNFMRRGGIWDHLGFGFHRYSMDPEWIIPHFEKMLYDQALMTLVYTEAYQATGKDEYKETVKLILDYILKEMTSPNGGFYTGEDAESRGLEGEFYLWTKNEVEMILTPYESRIFNEAYNIKENGNYQDPSTHLFNGKNILYLKAPLNLIAEEFELDLAELSKLLESIRKKLYHTREMRVRPHKDDKILTDWNGLMITAFAKASQIFDDDKYSKSAMKAVDFIKSQLYCEGRLWHRYRGGEVKVPGFLDDYAFMIYGLIELYQSTLDSSLLEWALELNQELIDDFFDDIDGGFYFTSRLEDDVLVRKKEAFDGSIPSGNALSYINLLHLSTLLEDSQFNDKALELEKAFAHLINGSPMGYTMFLTGLMFRLGPSYEVVIAGEKNDEATQELINVLRENYFPQAVLSLNSLSDKWFRDKVESFQDKKLLNGRVTAYVCESKGCRLPVTNSDELLELLS